MTSPVDKQKFLHEVFAILLTIADVAIQDHYLNDIAEQIHTRYEVLATQYKKYRATDGRFHLRQLQQPKTERYTINREILLGALVVQEGIKNYLTTETPQIKSLLTLINVL